MCSPGQHLPTFPTGYELCIVQERGTGAALHGDETGCSSRQPAELKDSHTKENRNIYFSNISAQPRKDKTVHLDPVSVRSYILNAGRGTTDSVFWPVPPLLHQREEFDQSWTLHLLVTSFFSVYARPPSRSKHRIQTSTFPVLNKDWKKLSRVAAALSAFCHPPCSLITAMISPHLSAQKKVGAIILPRTRAHKLATILTNKPPV